MTTQGAIPTHPLRAPLPRPTGAATRAARLPFLDPWPEASGNDLLLLNPRPDLTPAPEPAGRRGAFFEIILS